MLEFPKSTCHEWPLAMTDIFAPCYAEDPNYGLAIVNVNPHCTHTVDMAAHRKRRKIRRRFSIERIIHTDGIISNVEHKSI